MQYRQIREAKSLNFFKAFYCLATNQSGGSIEADIPFKGFEEGFRVFDKRMADKFTKMIKFQ